MSISSRQQSILHYLHTNGRTSVDNLAQQFAVSNASIRGDLRKLEAQKLVFRDYGGVDIRATIDNNQNNDLALNDKMSINLDKKIRIAKKAAEFVENGNSIILDCGSTTIQMAYELEQKSHLTVMTNSLDIVNALSELKVEHNIILSGGTLRKKSASFYGSLAEQAFSRFSFDKLFIGADGFDMDYGFTTYNETYHVSQAMCKSANQIVVVIDSSKFSRKSSNVVVPLDAIDVIITDNELNDALTNQLISKGISVYRV